MKMKKGVLLSDIRKIFCNPSIKHKSKKPSRFTNLNLKRERRDYGAIFDERERH